MERTKYEWGDGVYTLLSWFQKDKVKNARVLVAGAGALGNEVVKNLALFGVGHIFVVDFDRIEVSNLTRSVLFREEDAFNHAYKAEVVARRAMEINPQIKVTPIVGNLASEVGQGLYRSVDVVIGCLDSRIARYLLNRHCIRAGKTWVDGGIENLSGVVRTFVPGESCYECSLSREEFNHIMLRTGCADVVRRQESAGRVATTPISASIVAAIQVQEALKVIHRETLDENSYSTLQGKMLSYEGMNNSMRIFKFASWKHNCPAHRQWTDVRACPGLSAKLPVREAFALIKKAFGVKAVEIELVNNKFIDKIVSEKPEKDFVVKLPESKLDDFISANKELRLLSYRTIFHKSFFEYVDKAFPYPQLTLQEVGIPPYDVLQVATEKGMFFLELTDDASLFE